MKIYFAGSIRGGRDDHELYADIISLLQNYGDVLTEHVGGANLSVHGESLLDSEIYDRDLAWLREADVVVAEVTTPSLGVGYEIGKATEWNKRVLCLYRPADNRRLSGMLTGCPGVRVYEYRAVDELKEIFDEFLG